MKHFCVPVLKEIESLPHVCVWINSIVGCAKEQDQNKNININTNKSFSIVRNQRLYFQSMFVNFFFILLPLDNYYETSKNLFSKVYQAFNKSANRNNLMDTFSWVNAVFKWTTVRKTLMNWVSRENTVESNGKNNTFTKDMLVISCFFPENINYKQNWIFSWQIWNGSIFLQLCFFFVKIIIQFPSKTSFSLGKKILNEKNEW